MGAMKVEEAGEIGIEKISVYPCTMAIDMGKLVEARRENPDEICGRMMISERSVNPPWEDPVTMAVNGAKEMLTEEDKKKDRFIARRI